jgi:hypothetical protein
MGMNLHNRREDQFISANGSGPSLWPASRPQVRAFPVVEPGANRQQPVAPQTSGAYSPRVDFQTNAGIRYR